MMTSVNRHAPINLDELLQDFVAESYLSNQQITGLTSNSRQVRKGYLFIAQTGLTRHAIDFAGDAIDAGAVAVLYDLNDKYNLQRLNLLQKQYDIAFIPVENLQLKTGQIASRFYAYPSRQLTLIGVTGTDGKTSVTHLLVQAFNRLGKKAGSVGTLGYGVANNNLKMTHFTTPEAITLQSILFELSLAGCEYAVMEVSSHALEQHREAGCDFKFAVLTNLGSDHLDYHGDLEHYKAAKARLFAQQDLSAKIINLDDDFGQSLLAANKGERVTAYSLDQSVSSSHDETMSRVTLVTYSMGSKGLQLRISTPAGEIQIQTALIGDFNINNILCCASVLFQLGFELNEIEYCLQNLQPIPGRMEYFPAIDRVPAVVIDFAHTEQALSACLNSLKQYCQGKMICIFGCGGDRDQSKRPKMATVAEQLADQVIVTDDNPRNEPAEQIIRDILKGFKLPEKVRVIHDREVAIQMAISAATTDDMVVITGKGHEQYQIIGDQRLPFSDHYVVKQIRNRGTV